jgi:trans-aconitate 2-methyltransferase
MRYTFGHTNTAAERLRRIAEFFNPLAYDFIRDNLVQDAFRAADLGCGPGYTTDMLAKATHALEVFGIDISEYFINLCRKQYPKYSFIQGDVTNLESEQKYDLIYCRFLLSHLKDVPNLFKSWIALLNQGGMIFIDELEDIFTEIPVFKKYLEISNSLVRSQGGELYIGKNLEDYVNGFHIKSNNSDIIPVKNSMAAEWFYPNTVSIWETEDFIVKSVDKLERLAISKELQKMNAKNGKSSNITWKMKRIVLTK